MRRLLDYDRRRYWLVNGWSIRFRIADVTATAARPRGIQYAFTLHDVDGHNFWASTTHMASGAPNLRPPTPVRRGAELVAYVFRGADELIGDFFAAVEQACRQKGTAFEFEAGQVELEREDGDQTDFDG